MEMLWILCIYIYIMLTPYIYLDYELFDPTTISKHLEIIKLEII